MYRKVTLTPPYSFLLKQVMTPGKDFFDLPLKQDTSFERHLPSICRTGTFLSLNPRRYREESEQAGLAKFPQFITLSDTTSAL
jgi:hypothetical protein